MVDAGMFPTLGTDNERCVSQLLLVKLKHACFTDGVNLLFLNRGNMERLPTHIGKGQLYNYTVRCLIYHTEVFAA